MKNSLLIFLFIAFQITNLFPQQLALNNPNKSLDLYKTNEADSTNLKQHHKPEGPSFLFAQEFGIKAGIGFSYTYQTNEEYFYRNKLKHESDPSFILTFRANWHLVGDIYLAWEPGVIEKYGKITGIAVGYDLQNNVVYGYQEYTLWNLENSLLINYDVATIKDILVNVYIGPGLSINISDNQLYVPPKTFFINYSDNSYSHYDDPFLNDSGPYLTTGINLQYKNFQFDFRFIREYADIGVPSVGTHKSDLYCFLIGYLF